MKRMLLALGLSVMVLSSSGFAKANNSGLDVIIKIIQEDKSLHYKTSPQDRAIAIRSAKQMNRIILKSIRQTKIARDGKISPSDVSILNRHIVDLYAKKWKKLHGDDEKGKETGFHRVQKDGAKTMIFGKNAINNVFDGIYHLGFATNHKKRLKNEDGKKNKNFKKIARYLNTLLKEELRNKTI